MVRMATPGRLTDTPLPGLEATGTDAELATARALLAEADRALADLLEMISERRTDADVLTRAELSRIHLGRFGVTL